ncbi:hypothetical protein [Streptomyces sp. IB2014 011-1]|uniref:hypothetical protein n=1 Tax=Streptomyces sp. IB2014 011-1 TaxID=1844478 RepID=UPI000978E244|nr:hypothetical protein [Streptomyces sp. IB2014 011-1]ONI48513.1 hypothetical protein STIB_73380 [Streptomyces sp. IB2014 011-1]
MSKNQTYSGLHLPDGMRVLSAAEMRRVHDAASAAARRHGVRGYIAAEIVFDALATAGVFNEPLSPDPDTCTAQYLPHDPAEFDADTLGVWQQCDEEPGHDDDHDSGEIGWPEGAPGSLPPKAAS